MGAWNASLPAEVMSDFVSGAIELGAIPLYLVVVTLALSASCCVTLGLADMSQSLLSELTTYGKTNAHLHKNITKYIAVPKRYFRHFYIVAVLSVGGWLLYAWLIYRNVVQPESWSKRVLRNMSGGEAKIPWTLGVFVLCLQMVHVFRRCCETLFISVYSDTEMNVFHYLMGILHYIVLPLAVTSEMIGIAKQADDLSFDVSLLGLQQVFGVVVFVLANYMQNRITKELADVRKDPDGLVRSHSHAIFYGGMFDYVSCPHFFFEILIYLSLWLTIGQYCSVFKYLAGFVIVNQIFAAKITHNWYKKNFKNYPENRKAIIPFVF